MCRAVLAVKRRGGEEAGPGGEGRPAAQYRPRRSCSGHTVQDGIPS